MHCGLCGTLTIYEFIQCARTDLVLLPWPCEEQVVCEIEAALERINCVDALCMLLQRQGSEKGDSPHLSVEAVRDVQRVKLCAFTVSLGGCRKYSEVWADFL